MKLISTGSQYPTSNGQNTNSPQTSKELKVSANAAKKARIHGQRVISMVYCIVVLAISIGIILYSTGHRVAETEPSFVWFFNTLYLTSVTGMLCVLGYIYKNRHGSIEAIEKGSSTAPQILFSLQGEPVSLYLRIGLCIFTVMAIAHTVCRAFEISLTSKDFHWVIPFASSKILFFIVQTIFILVLHRLVVLARKRLFSLILLHLITVNLCFWVDSAIEKISQSVTMEHSNANHTLVTIRYRLKATSYFLPAIPEYCAISVAVIFEMSQRIGQFRQIEDGHQAVKKKHETFKLPSAVGFVIAVLFCVIILILILYLESAGARIDHFRSIIHLTEMCTIQVVAIGCCILGIVFVRKLKFSVNFAKNSLDEKLLLTTFFLAVNFLVASIILCISYATNGKLNSKQVVYMYIQLINLLLELFQVILQTYFIHDMLYRCCHHEAYQHSKPGRVVIVILSALNFSLWMIYSFQVKHNDVLFKVSGKYFEESRLQALHMFITVILPMVMLFRYHSSVCLAIAFVRIYEDEVTRYESILRWVKEGTTKELLQKRISILSGGESEFAPLIPPSALKQLPSHKTIPSSDLWIIAPSLSTLTSTESTAVSNSVEFEDLPAIMPKIRRNTQTVWEVARKNISARESFHQLTKMKLIRQQQKKMSTSTNEKNASKELRILEEAPDENCSMKSANELTPTLEHTKYCLANSAH
ncbi:hypothetical protein EG68_00438 [Paragonimus skrjabini miyazakii]|uniref:Otopetrin n=1 Tax=Paragonimus skrjabini miyazakii TaxID=59628 RepID=A0A8S9Z9D0_9TREM|nr:hypothetical protein EG68_00438 [Paragonimus skrjabini miyazakii]